MKNIICEESVSLGRAASSWFQEKIIQYSARSAFIPAGRSPMALYEIWREQRPAYLDGFDLLQVDDVLTGAQRGIFRNFFADKIPHHIKQLKFIDEADACADLAVLGLGLNGHVGFHEPGLDRNLFSGCVRLSETSCRRLGLESGTWGVTYGAGAFLKTKAILMIVSGSTKRDILRRLLQNDPALPASALAKHPDFTILVDDEALPHGLGLVRVSRSRRKIDHHGAA